MHIYSDFFCTLTHLLTRASPLPAPPILQILNEKVEIKVESKVGSMDNVKHKAGGGDKKVFNDVEYLRQTSAMHAAAGASSGSSSRRQSASQVRKRGCVR